LQYDDVANDQRKVIYAQRDDLIHADNISEAIRNMRLDVVENVFRSHVAADSIEEQWQIAELEQSLLNEFGVELPIQQWLDEDDDIDQETILTRIVDHFETEYRQKVDFLGPEIIAGYEKDLMLMVLDRHWREHLAAMDYLRQGIGLRGYAQKNPVQEYKRESFEMFTDMLEGIKYEAIQSLTRVQIRSEAQVEALEQSHVEDTNIKLEHASAQNLLNAGAAEGEGEAVEHQPYVRKQKKIGRNAPCWCGSGKKFKQCHGKL
jgi:preprotein translocase subunit SecA